MLVAPDKFRSTASAADLRLRIAKELRAAGHFATEIAISDGGEGLLDALGGDQQLSEVDGPLGDPVLAEWRLRSNLDGSKTAVIEMARASGMALVGDASSNDPMRASTRGTGQLIREALLSDANHIIVGCGGSATTDGGLGAVEVLRDLLPTNEISLLVACDVTTTFVDAADVFGPQKGATPTQVSELRRRLHNLARTYQDEFGVSLTDLKRSGAAGGLAGGLAALGGKLVSGIHLVADEIDLDQRIGMSDLVITGEGRFDRTSLSGKVVGELLDRTRGRCPLQIIVGEAVEPLDTQRNPAASVTSLTTRFGLERAVTDTLECVGLIAREIASEL